MCLNRISMGVRVTHNALERNMSDVKLCKDCVFSASTAFCSDILKCHCPKAEIDLTNGQTTVRWCSVNRLGTGGWLDQIIIGHPRCGKPGRWFEPKP